ncbi:MAG: MarR family transcriptional regulator [Saccharolobus sp.]|uniref:MarR family transcriptional regulator n=1 Tax=Saccharolobus sp. TaxID=2100761 RepID=UPI00315E4030
MARNLTTPGGKILLLLDEKNTELTVTEIVEIMKKNTSATTITNWLRELEKLGLIEVREERTPVGTRKKLVGLTEKGKLAAEYLRRIIGVIQQ